MGYTMRVVRYVRKAIGTASKRGAPTGGQSVKYRLQEEGYLSRSRPSASTQSRTEQGEKCDSPRTAIRAARCAEVIGVLGFFAPTVPPCTLTSTSAASVRFSFVFFPSSVSLLLLEGLRVDFSLLVSFPLDRPKLVGSPFRLFRSTSLSWTLCRARSGSASRFFRFTASLSWLSDSSVPSVDRGRGTEAGDVLPPCAPPPRLCTALAEPAMFEPPCFNFVSAALSPKSPGSPVPSRTSSGLFFSWMIAFPPSPPVSPLALPSAGSVVATASMSGIGDRGPLRSPRTSGI